MPLELLLQQDEMPRAVWRGIWTGNLILLTADHLVTGFMGIVWPNKALSLYRRIFGVEMPSSPELLLVLRPWGALGVFAGLATLFPIVDPVRYKGILFALLILLVFRLVIRGFMKSEADRLFQLSKTRNAFHLCLILLSALLIASELWRL